MIEYSKLLKTPGLLDYPSVPVEINGNTITVMKYVTAEAQNDLIQLAAQKAEEDGVYNPIKLDFFFAYFFTRIFTDIDFGDEEEELAVFEKLRSEGVIDTIIDAVSKEYQALYDKMERWVSQKIEANKSIARTLGTFLQDIVPNSEQALAALQNFNPDKLTQLTQYIGALQKAENI